MPPFAFAIVAALDLLLIVFYFRSGAGASRQAAGAPLLIPRRVWYAESR